jgi:DNA-directed RNA polymerase subunit RPC12/RpoP
MDAQGLLLVAGTAVAAGGAAVLVANAWRARRGRAAAEAPPELEVVRDGPAPTTVPVADLDAVPFTLVQEPPAREAVLVAVTPGGGSPFHEPARSALPLPPILREDRHAQPPAPQPIPTEWARRQVGPASPGRTKGACSGCGAMLSVSTQRPLRIACPVCGRSRLLA